MNKTILFVCSMIILSGCVSAEKRENQVRGMMAGLVDMRLSQFRDNLIKRDCDGIIEKYDRLRYEIQEDILNQVK